MYFMGTSHSPFQSNTIFMKEKKKKQFKGIDQGKTSKLIVWFHFLLKQTVL